MGTIGAGTTVTGTAGVRVESVYRPRHPVDLRMTLGPLSRGGQSPTMLWDARGVWLTSRTVVGTATVLLNSVRGEVIATGWGDGAESAVAAVPELLGDGDDWTGLDVSANEFLRTARRRAVGLRLLRTGHVLDAVIAAIIEQKVTSVEAWRAWRQLVTRYGEAAPGPAPARMRVTPSPASWCAIPTWVWHRAGVDPRRATAVIAAARVASGLERTLRLGRGGPEVLARLQSVPGIGPWTAAEASQRAHGDPDSVSVGDYHLPAIVGWALIGKPVDDDGMLELLEPWRGHRQRVMRLIGVSGFRAPRFGPRITIQDHRRH
ncbi:DNA-3-methyladenine glycosylase [Parafrigoribacterium mesophilum]|uniref:DNA-3-methyladenine glycosylase family protein n=1 Tax=Parafrigoribacterium mesophilum TaxID=433646 RepID=UPI0031FC95B3